MPIIYSLRKARKFTGTRKEAKYIEVWQQFLPITPVKTISGMMICEWIDVPVGEWATEEDEEKHNQATKYEYIHGR